MKTAGLVLQAQLPLVLHLFAELQRQTSKKHPTFFKAWNFSSKDRKTKMGNTWVFPKIGVPQNGWFIMESPVKMDDLGVALFLEIPTWFQQGSTNPSKRST